MMSLLARLIFAITLVMTAVFFLFGSQYIVIETGLNDLNPEKIDDAGMKQALDTLNQDVSQRFVVVIKGEDDSAVSQASAAMQGKLNQLPSLSVIDEDEVQKNYLNALTPYRFNLLSETQRQALGEQISEQLAVNAQRKLYQLGNGVRVIPFDEDPMGWFSDFVLSQVAALDIEANDSEKADYAVASFSVFFSQYPENMAQQESLYQAIRAIEASISEQYHVNVLHSGMFFFAVDSAQSAKSDIQLIAIGSILGVLVLMLVVFRSLLPLMLSLSSIAIGVSFGVLASILMFGSVHVLTIVFGASLIGIVVDYSLHYFYHFLAHQRDNSAGTHTRTLVRAMVLSVLTSLIGYGALGLADLIILKKIALFSCSGLFMAWLSVMVLGPLVTKRPIEARQAMLRQVIHGCQAVFARKPSWLIAGGLALAGAAAVFLIMGNAAVNDDPRRFFHVSPSLLMQESEAASLAQVYEPGRYLLVQGESREAVFNAFTSLYEELGNDSRSIFSILDWLPSPSQQRDYYRLQEKLYEDGGAVDIFSSRLGLDSSAAAKSKAAYREAQDKTLEVPELLAALPSLPPLWIEQNGQIYGFALIKKNSDLAKIEEISGRVAQLQYVNTLAKATEALKAQRITGSQLLVLAYLLIALVLTLYYRKIATLSLLLIPMVASVITLATVSLAGQSITVFHIMALFLVLGLGMDYIIFAKEMASQRATTQQAILLSAVTSLLSFGLLAFSSMPIVQAFGSTILIGNTINFIAAISLFNHHSQERKERPHAG